VPGSLFQVSSGRGRKALTRLYSSESPEFSGKFSILDEKVSFQRYQTVYERLIRYPNGKRVSFDVFGNPRSDFKSVFVFPYDTRTKTVTLLREYIPGINEVMWGFPAGGFDPKKHKSLEDAARSELSEEAFLTGGSYFPMLESGGVSQDKYSKNMFHMFLVLNPVEDENPLPRDEEEYIQIVKGVTLPRLQKILAQGGMNLPSGFCGYRALDALSNPTPELASMLYER